MDRPSTGTALSPLFLFGKDLPYALLPPPAAQLKPSIEASHGIAAKGGEDVEIPSLRLTVEGLQEEICPDAKSRHHHDDLEGDSLVPLCPLSSILRFHSSL
jgi:hypothetical protein